MIGIIIAVLNQYPEYFYAVTPNPNRPFALRVAIGVVPIMVIITTIWLIGKISSKSLVQALAKIVAWMLLVGATWMNLVFYFVGLFIGFQILGGEAGGLLIPGFLGFFLFCPVVAYLVIAPKYRDTYPDISFLKKRAQLISLIIATHIFLFLFTVATH